MSKELAEEQEESPKRKYKKRKKKVFKTCPHCNLVLTDTTYDYFKGHNAVTKRLESLIKKHSIDRKKLAKILRCSENTIIGWETNKKANIHEGYFALLEIAGYK